MRKASFYDIDYSQANILRFKPAGKPVRPPHNMPLWWDVCKYMRFLFMTMPNVESVTMSVEQFIYQLEQHWGVQYSDEQKERLEVMCELDNEKDLSGQYIFYKTDFFKPVS